MISREEIEKVARLAKINLSSEEKISLTKELGDIIHFVETLNELDLKDVEVTSHAVQVSNVFRADEAVKCEIQKNVLELAPQREDSFFQVPRII